MILSVAVRVIREFYKAKHTCSTTLYSPYRACRYRGTNNCTPLYTKNRRQVLRVSKRLVVVIILLQGRQVQVRAG